MKYKVGDKVRVKTDLETGELYGCMSFLDSMAKMRGKVVTIKSLTACSYRLREHDDPYWTDEMFECLVEETPREFKVGDRVKNLTASWGSLKSGDLGTIIEINDKDCIGVEFDERCGGHNCNGKGKPGHCWLVFTCEVELVEEAPKEEPKETPTPTPVVNINVTVNHYENACWYCRKGGLVDLYFNGLPGICPKCGRVMNMILPNNMMFNNNKRKETPKKPKENKPLTTEELRALPNGTRVFTVWLERGEPLKKDARTCWRTVNANRLERKNGDCGFSSNGNCYNAYLEMPEGYVDNDP